MDNPIPFLKSVAIAYASRYPDLSDFLFVFPNKRSGTFFLKYLAELADSPKLAPQSTTISEFINVTSGQEAESRISLLFTLYDAYRSLNQGNETYKDDFNLFRNWGDVVIADFNAADMSAVDAEELFSNVRKHHSIQSSFLTAEQLDVLEQYFGVSYSREHLDKFWLSMDYVSSTRGEKRHTDIREHFKSLWEILGPLYREFNRRLADKEATYPGRAARLAYANLSEGQRPDADKIVFVGFNVLTKMEWLIFDTLRKLDTDIGLGTESYADFIWDATGPVLGDSDQEDQEGQSALRFLHRNKKRFPHPVWAAPYLELSSTESLPSRLELHSSPGNTMQCKIAGNILADLRTQTDARTFEDAKVAMVLPDEWLLLPSLYSIPESVGNVNLTMGYPLKLTSVLSFLDRIRALQARQRTVAGEYGFFHEDLMLLLGHPMMQKLISPGVAAKLKGHIKSTRKYVMTTSQISSVAKDTEFIFRSVRDMDAQATIEYLDTILQRLQSKLYADIQEPEADTSPEIINSLKKAKQRAKLEASHIDTCRDALCRLGEAIAEHDIDMDATTLFALTDRLLGAEKVVFEGEPLEGLQVMGLLETRCLDFDYVILPSMSEKIFPMRMRSKTFIPDSLRQAFGIPPSTYEESVFAYYFYRLISRAKGVYMIHDARVQGLHSGDVSRYVQQLDHLYAKGEINKYEHTFSVSSPKPRKLSVSKVGEVQRRLKEFYKPDSKFRLSASAINDYLACPMKFFFSRVAGFNSDNPPTEFMDAATAGTIVHGAVEALYIPNETERGKLLHSPKILDSKLLKTIINTEGYIEKTVEKLIREIYLKQQNKSGKKTALPEDAAISLKMLSRQTHAVIGHDLHLASHSGPITLYGTEIRDTFLWPLANGEKVNIRFAIDRLDRIGDMPDAAVRIVDYKTGYTHLNAADTADIFNPEGKGTNIFQLQLYANALNMLRRNKICAETDAPVRMELYDISDIIAGDHSPHLPVIGDETILHHRQRIAAPDGTDKIDLNEDFMVRFQTILEEIFDFKQAFEQTESKSACKFCNFKVFCER